MFQQLLYISSVTRPMLRIDIEQILFTARRHNLRNEITGILIASNRRFMQVLEGDRIMVRDTYNRICRDERHSASLILRETETSERQFGDWSMASQYLDDTQLGMMTSMVRDAVSGCDIITSGYLMGFAEQGMAA